MTATLRDAILDTALRLADASSWEAVRLHQVAAALGISLDDIRSHYREKEDLVDAWFDRADRALLEQARLPDVAADGGIRGAVREFERGGDDGFQHP